ncbi:unnamed protein product [Meganyctiphanes norvegica]|uniref:D-3-phosphoglycerate dehydrogenase n=1 Tax=Meganyctiphanes norvegica TaxID=48144 RepID=A0AAV2RAT2_MEGNR
MSSQIEKVLLLDGVDPICAEELTKSGLQVTVKGKQTTEQLLELVKQYDAIVVRSATKVTAEVLAAPGSRLKLVGRAGTGVDNIDVQAATRKGVIVMNTPGGNTLSAAEHTCVLICSLSRSVPQACQSLKQGKWDRKTFLGNELFGKTLAIIGLGRIGREVSTRMKAFGMNVIGYDPMVPAEIAQSWGIEFQPLDQIWANADYITVHVPLIPATRNLINEKVFAACKPGVRILNVARGGIIDETALLQALESGKCGGAALDVFLEEPPTDFTLCQHPKIICTPHLGANTVEAQKRVALEIAQQMVDMIQGRPLVGVINAPALSSAMSESSRPWIQLAESLGYLARNLSQSADSPAITVQVTLYGSELLAMKSFIGSAVAVGMMRGVTPNGINLVNAPLLAKESGITLSVEAAEEGVQFPVTSVGSDAVQLRVTVGLNIHTLVGSSSGGLPTLYALDGAIWESGLTLGRNMLFFRAAKAASPLANIATQLVATQAALVSLLSSAPSSKEVWHVARTEENVTFPQTTIPNTQLVAQLMF